MSWRRQMREKIQGEPLFNAERKALVDRFPRHKGKHKSILDLVPCVLVTFEKEQIVIWRRKDYKPTQGGYFLKTRESFDDSNDDLTSSTNGDEKTFFVHSDNE